MLKKNILRGKKGTSKTPAPQDLRGCGVPWRQAGLWGTLLSLWLSLVAWGGPVRSSCAQSLAQGILSMEGLWSQGISAEDV